MKDTQLEVLVICLRQTGKAIWVRCCNAVISDQERHTLACYCNYYFPVLKEDCLISTLSFGCVIYTTKLSLLLLLTKLLLLLLYYYIVIIIIIIIIIIVIISSLFNVDVSSLYKPIDVNHTTGHNYLQKFVIQYL